MDCRTRLPLAAVAIVAGLMLTGCNYQTQTAADATCDASGWDSAECAYAQRSALAQADRTRRALGNAGRSLSSGTGYRAPARTTTRCQWVIDTWTCR